MKLSRGLTSLILSMFLLSLINVGGSIKGRELSVPTMALEILKIAKELWEIYEGNPRDLINTKFKALSSQYDLIEAGFEKVKDEISAINKKIDSLPAIMQLTGLMINAQSPFQKLSNKYEKMREYAEKRDKYNEMVVQEFAKAAISPNDGIDSLVTELNGLIVRTPAFPSISLLKLLVENSEVIISYFFFRYSMSIP